MAEILKFPLNPPKKFGFKPVRRKRKKTDPEDFGQLNLFEQTPPQIYHLPIHQSVFESALFWDERGDERAVDLYREAISSGECVADAWCNLGILESNRGNAAKALDCFTLALKEDPRHFEAHYNLANLYFDAGDYQLAKLHYQTAAEIDGSFPNLYFNLGLVLALKGEYEEAVKALCDYQALVSETEACHAEELLNTLRRSLSVRS